MRIAQNPHVLRAVTHAQHSWLAGVSVACLVYVNSREHQHNIYVSVRACHTVIRTITIVRDALTWARQRAHASAVVVWRRAISDAFSVQP